MYESRSGECLPDRDGSACRCKNTRLRALLGATGWTRRLYTHHGLWPPLVLVSGSRGFPLQPSLSRFGLGEPSVMLMEDNRTPLNPIKMGSCEQQNLVKGHGELCISENRLLNTSRMLPNPTSNLRSPSLTIALICNYYYL